MDNSKGPGRPQGALKGATAQANELAVFVRHLTKDQTVRQLAVQYMGGRTAWSLYRSGAQVIPLHLLEKVVRDQRQDQAGRDLLLSRARALHERAAAAAPADPVPPVPIPRPAPAVRPRRRLLTHTAVAVAAVAVSVAVTLVVTRPSASTPPVAPKPSGMPETLVARTEAGVDAYNPVTGAWTRIGGPAESVYGGPGGLVAVAPNGNVSLFRSPGSWGYIGERPAELAVGPEHVYRLSPDRAAVWEWVDEDLTWRMSGAAARRLYAGGAGLFASSPEGTALFQYTGGRPDEWLFVTDQVSPDDTIVVGTDALYRLTADRSAVLEWRLAEPRWSRIGGRARSIHAGGAGLFMIDESGALHAYADGEWTPVGDGGAGVAVGTDHVYRRMPDGALAMWTPADQAWTDLGTRALAITVAGG